MKVFLKYLGLALILLGVAVLVAIHILGITFVNKLTLTPFLMIVMGAVLFVWMTKRESRY